MHSDLYIYGLLNALISINYNFMSKKTRQQI